MLATTTTTQASTELPLPSYEPQPCNCHHPCCLSNVQASSHNISLSRQAVETYLKMVVTALRTSVRETCPSSSASSMTKASAACLAFMKCSMSCTTMWVLQQTLRLDLCKTCGGRLGRKGCVQYIRNRHLANMSTCWPTFGQSRETVMLIQACLLMKVLFSVRHMPSSWGFMSDAAVS